MAGQLMITAHARVTEQDIEALVDSGLGWEREKQVWREIARNAALRAFYGELIAQKKLLALWWASEDDADAGEPPAQKKTPS